MTQNRQGWGRPKKRSPKPEPPKFHQPYSPDKSFLDVIDEETPEFWHDWAGPDAADVVSHAASVVRQASPMLQMLSDPTTYELLREHLTDVGDNMLHLNEGFETAHDLHERGEHGMTPKLFSPIPGSGGVPRRPTDNFLTPDPRQKRPGLVDRFRPKAPAAIQSALEVLHYAGQFPGAR